MTNRGSGHCVEYMTMLYPALVNDVLFPTEDPSSSVHVHGGVDMQPFPDPLHTSHPLVERVRMEALVTV